MLSLLITIIFIAIWIAPWYLKAKPDKTIQKKMWLGFLLCMTLGALVSTFLTAQAGKLLKFLSTGFTWTVLDTVEVAILEEAVKCFIAVRLSKKLEHARVIDYVLIFGMVGAGFEFIESVMYGIFMAGGRLLILVLRGIFSGHIFYLYLTGFGYAAYRAGNHSVFYRNFAIAAALHFLFDIGATMMGDASLSSEFWSMASIAAELAAIISSICLVVVMIRKIRKACADTDLV